MESPAAWGGLEPRPFVPEKAHYDDGVKKNKETQGRMPKRSKRVSAMLACCRQ